MCLSHDRHETLTNAVHLLKTSVVTVANLGLITSPHIASDGLHHQRDSTQNESNKSTNSRDLTLLPSHPCTCVQGITDD